MCSNLYNLGPLREKVFFILLKSTLFPHYIYVFSHSSSSNQQNPFRSQNSSCVLVAVLFLLLTQSLYFTRISSHTHRFQHFWHLGPFICTNLDLSFKIQADSPILAFYLMTKIIFLFTQLRISSFTRLSFHPLIKFTSFCLSCSHQHSFGTKSHLISAK